MIFLDSTVLIDYFNGRDNWQVEVLDRILGQELVVIGDYVLAEVLQGFRTDADFQEAKQFLLSFPCYDMGGIDIAIKCAKNYRYLRKRGVTIRNTIDSMIATFCIENQFTLLHNDKDFTPYTEYLSLQVLRR